MQFEDLAYTNKLKGIAVTSKDLKTLECIEPDKGCVRDFFVKGDYNGKCAPNTSHHHLQERTHHLTSKPLCKETCFASNMVKKKTIVFIFFRLPTNVGVRSLASYDQLYKTAVNLCDYKLRTVRAVDSLPLRPVNSVDITKCKTLRAARSVVEQATRQVDRDVEVRYLDVTLGTAKNELTVTVPPLPSSSSAFSFARQERHPATSTSADSQHRQQPSTVRNSGSSVLGTPPSSPVLTPGALDQSPTS